MKKFLTISIILFFIVANIINSHVTNTRVDKDSPYFAKIEKKDIYIAKNQKWEKVNLVGVNLDNTKPGTFPLENNVSEEEFLRWIGYIYDMGANCIKVPNLMGETFYSALQKFNENKKEPMYLIQGIYFDETYLNNGYDPQSIDTKATFNTNVKLIIDSVHGNPYNYNKPDILQHYKFDVSDYIIGYTLGIDFAKHDLIYTEIMNENNIFRGDYLYTTSNASSFEAYLASVGEYLIDYEYKTYKKQSLIGFIGSTSRHITSGKVNPIDMSILSEDEDDDKYKDYVDPENIKSKGRLKTGIYASYNVYPSYTEVREYENNLDEYFKKINGYHSMPVIIGEYGIPSSRSGGDFNIASDTMGVINEKEQGEALVSILKSINEANMAGSFIAQFQDGWHASSSNTKDLKILDKSAYWSDAQTYSQSFGIMAFDPGKKQSICYPDDSIDEWNDDDIINENNSMSLSMKRDERYLYFMVKAAEDFTDKEIYIDLDITPNSGTKKSSQYNLEFDDEVDFIININGRENSAIKVHEYYNRFNFDKDKKANKARPDLISKTKDMDVFSDINIQIRPKMYNEMTEQFEEEVIYETGKLIHGNANPNSDEFNSVSDFYRGNDYVEIRIPWGLLNFTDPTIKQIQDDFYEIYHMKSIMINNINVGVTIKDIENNEAIRLSSGEYNLDGWIKPTYNERLKQSYYILKKELKRLS